MRKEIMGLLVALGLALSHSASAIENTSEGTRSTVSSSSYKQKRVQAKHKRHLHEKHSQLKTQKGKIQRKVRYDESDIHTEKMGYGRRTMENKLPMDEVFPNHE